MKLNVLIAPSGFKESLGADEVTDCIAAGVLRVLPEARIMKAPLVDGGEGFTKALVAATGGGSCASLRPPHLGILPGGTLHNIVVTGPVGQPVPSHFGFLGGKGPKTAVLEMAAAAGLRLVPRECRDPLVTTTFGVGELIKAALDAGAERVLIGCGDSGTNDGGAGMAQALGIRLLDNTGKEIGRGGGALDRLARIDLSGRDPRIDQIHIDVACNWHNVLCGPNGVARVFGPQKGASPETVERLAAALDRYAGVLKDTTGIDVRGMPGGGASGGLGAGLCALLGARLHSRYEIVMQYLELDSLLAQADVVFTAEGSIDFQTPRGKIPAEVARRAKKYGLPVITLAGTIGKNACVNLECGIDAYTSIMEAPCTLADAIENAPRLLEEATEHVMRMILIGTHLEPKTTFLPQRAIVGQRATA